ncbi:MAG: CDP-alcohol phosphatidyltransferase family protein [bacterium]|jgi:phosphatidylglycerophosphate synthase
MNLSKPEFRQMQLAVMASPGEPVYARLVLRRLSFWLTPIVANWPITPNTVTVWSIIAGTAGAVCLMIPGLGNYVTGVTLVLVWYFLDVIDGDLARFKRMQSLTGVYLDTLGHYIVNPLIFASFSIYLAIKLNCWIYIGLGFVAFLIHQYSRLARDISKAIKYAEIDKKANPRQVLGEVNSIPTFKTVQMLTLKIAGPASYILDTVSVTFLSGILRFLLAHHYIGCSVAIYLLLVLAVFAGTTLIVIGELKELRGGRPQNER